MRSRESGFTLIEIVIAVAIVVILLGAGGIWMASMQPGALRGAVNDVDADFAAAQSMAESSGNGATLVFAPQPNGAPGFTLRVYSGRPNAANAVTATNVMQLSSKTTLSEAHFGAPPFAVFLNSAGYPTGIANYPALDAQENPTFSVIAQQPACPSGGIELTFTSPQGATATRTYACTTLVAGIGASPAATPTPNPMKVAPQILTAHWTTDTGPLKFMAAEYGYFHWVSSTTAGAACGQNMSSDTGAPPVYFATPYPYAGASPASESAAAPSPPANTPYTWPSGDPNDPPAWFQLSTVAGNGGVCDVSVEDDNGQSGAVHVQVMGNFMAAPTSLTLTVGQPAQAVVASKTFDSETIVPRYGGNCAKYITVATAAGTTPASPSKTPATATYTVSPIAAGSCTLILQDQYGEQVPVPINVKSNQAFGTWPASLVIATGGSSVGTTSSGALAMTSGASLVARIAPVLNALLGGGVARAGSVYTGACYAQAFVSGKSGPIDTSLFTNDPAAATALGVTVTTDGCILNAGGTAPYGGSTPTGVMVAYEPAGSGQTGNYTTAGGNCIQTGPWYPGDSGAQTLLPATGSLQASCAMDFSDGHSTQTPTADAGAVAVNVLQGTLFMSVTCTGFSDQEGDRGCSVSCVDSGCTTEGQSIETPCVTGPSYGGDFVVSTGEGTSTNGIVGQNSAINVTTSSDGTATIQGGSCGAGP